MPQNRTHTRAAGRGGRGGSFGAAGEQVSSRAKQERDKGTHQRQDGDEQRRRQPAEEEVGITTRHPSPVHGGPPDAVKTRRRNETTMDVPRKMTTAGQEAAGIETSALHRSATRGSASRGTAPREPALTTPSLSLATKGTRLPTPASARTHTMAVATRSTRKPTSPLTSTSSPNTRPRPRRRAALVKHAPPSTAPRASSRQSRRTARPRKRKSASSSSTGAERVKQQEAQLAERVKQQTARLALYLERTDRELLPGVDRSELTRMKPNNFQYYMKMQSRKKDEKGPFQVSAVAQPTARDLAKTPALTDAQFRAWREGAKESRKKYNAFPPKSGLPFDR